MSEDRKIFGVGETYEEQMQRAWKKFTKREMRKEILKVGDVITVTERDSGRTQYIVIKEIENGQVVVDISEEMLMEVFIQD